MAVIIALLVKNACDGGGYRRFGFVKTSAGNVVAATGWYASLQENQDTNYTELQYMNSMRNRL